MIELSGVSKTYPNGTTALRDLDLTIHQGSFTCVVGPSGCGKSTVLRLIAKLAKPTTGSITWQDDSRTHNLGYVFQEPTLMPWSRVWANVYLPLRLEGLSKAAAKNRVDEVLALVGLSDFREAYPRELSGGMKMRVAIARALITKPEVLLMDEPFAALDEITRFRLNDDLLNLCQQQNLTTVFVTHSVYESVYLADRVVVMADRPGRVTDDVAIDAAYPRDESFRLSGEYAQACARVSQSLREAVA